MSLTIGGIDPVKGIIDLEVRVGLLERLLEKAAANGLKLTQEDIETARLKSIEEVQKKYLHLGLEIRK